MDPRSLQSHPRRQVRHRDPGASRRNIELAVEIRRDGHARRPSEKPTHGVERRQLQASGTVSVGVGSRCGIGGRGCRGDGLRGFLLTAEVVVPFADDNQFVNGRKLGKSAIERRRSHRVASRHEGSIHPGLALHKRDSDGLRSGVDHGCNPSQHLARSSPDVKGARDAIECLRRRKQTRIVTPGDQQIRFRL